MCFTWTVLYLQALHSFFFVYVVRRGTPIYHVERAINRIKTYRILKTVLPITILHCGDDILDMHWGRWDQYLVITKKRVLGQILARVINKHIDKLKLYRNLFWEWPILESIFVILKQFTKLIPCKNLSYEHLYTSNHFVGITSTNWVIVKDVLLFLFYRKSLSIINETNDSYFTPD